MRIFSKILPLSLALALLVPAAHSADGIYDRDLVRGFLSLKGDFRTMKSDGVKFINGITGKSYSRDFVGGHLDIGAEYNRMLTWFDVNFMPITPTRGDTEWFTYGVTWMWGYKLLSKPTGLNIIPAIGPGFELQNIRSSEEDKLFSSFGPALNLELEFRVQFTQFSFGLYGGYKVVRFDNYDDKGNQAEFPRDVNADKAFAGLKFTWTMLNNVQKRERDLY